MPIPDEPGQIQERTPGVPPPVPPPPLPRSCEVDSGGSVSLRNVLAGVLAVLLLGAAAYFAYGFYETRGVRGEVAAPHQASQERIKGQIAALRAKSHALPPCPLVFPLLDKQKRVTSLGSYLSYLGMKRASYLPEAVFRIPNAGEIFNSFELFSIQPQPVQEVNRQELPFRFRAKDFGEGTYQETAGGFDISIRFWGTLPEKRYTRRFEKGELFRAPEWIAVSLHEWLGFKRNDAQSKYLEAPIYTCTEDFLRGANLERLFRSEPALANRWDGILEKNPDNALLFDRW